MNKLIKDVVHGYISFNEKLIDIINSPEFQRLKNIRQTSYNSLYPSSSHDRFTHSLGVYKLGEYAFDHFKENVSKDYADKNIEEAFWDKTKEIFLLACLLHDVGHSPFSHTGEYFYLRKRSESQRVYIYDELMELVDNQDFSKQFKNSIIAESVAKPHEIMSSIIGIKKWLSSSLKEDKELFARMIIGLTYEDCSNIRNGIYNALIFLLNSSVIDVDKLDYLLRDQIMTGFEGVGIDTERLLASVCLVNQKSSGKEKYHLGYYKNALSVIENVVVAHDSEKKWIQTHSVVSYDSFLVQQCIKAIESVYCKKKNTSIFCEETLGVRGIKTNKRLIRLLCDADVIFLAKQIEQEHHMREYIDEYFDRGIRKKAIWKSESEFDLMLRELGDSDRETFVEWMDELASEFSMDADGFEHSVIINDNVLKEITNEQGLKDKDADLPETEKSSARAVFESKRQKIEILKTFAKKNNIDFNFVITWSKRFKSNVDKFKKDDILIQYKNFERPKAIGEIISTYSLNEQSSISGYPNVYYLFYKRTANNSVSPVSFIKQFVSMINETN